ncbi:hypothetical protein OV079_15240 [Nannocystis pusilla]|uniref:Lytic transglycosylase domain-containing protein n=1 Tax=Nannocystis pusilla TaxID=889268 RepID=A0A9X3IXV0_9BACT|nr:hypothetical protein [Nannocystis pusilla]MCY1006884.1 hypothetical protein [Nannocystis pusilla]
MGAERPMSRRQAWQVQGACAAVLAAILSAHPGPVGAAEPSYRRYTDAQGVVHVTPVRAVGAGRREVEEMPGSGGEGGAPKTAAAEAEPSAPRRDPQVEVAEALADERSRRWETHIRGAARLYQLPESLVRAVIHTESNYYPGRSAAPGRWG